jgi:hypothetical protein
MGESLEKYKLFTHEAYKLKNGNITKKISLKILLCNNMKELLVLRRKLGMVDWKKQ